MAQSARSPHEASRMPAPATQGSKALAHSDAAGTAPSAGTPQGRSNESLRGAAGGEHGAANRACLDGERDLGQNLSFRPARETSGRTLRFDPRARPRAEPSFRPACETSGRIFRFVARARPRAEQEESKSPCPVKNRKSSSSARLLDTGQAFATRQAFEGFQSSRIVIEYGGSFTCSALPPFSSVNVPLPA